MEYSGSIKSICYSGSRIMHNTTRIMHTYMYELVHV